MSTYSFLDVKAAIVGPGGAFSLGSDSGASDEGITITPKEEINSMTIGAGGDVMHSLHADKSGTVSIKLLKTSKTNALLQALYSVQTAFSTLHGQNVITIVDSARGDVITCRDVAFAKAPALVYDKDGKSNDWEFHAGKIDRVLGAGNVLG